MIIKSFELQKIKSLNSPIILIYGNNEGLKEQIINDCFIKDFKGEILNYDEIDILNNKEEFISNLLNRSLFEDNKAIIISRATEKLIDTIIDIYNNEDKCCNEINTQMTNIWGGRLYFIFLLISTLHSRI